MAVERKFIQDALKRVQVSEYLEEKLERVGLSKADIQRTPMMTRVNLVVGNAARVIGKGGRDIKNLTEDLQKDFGLENPQIDVKEVENPETDPMLIAKKVARMLEKGDNVRRILHSGIKDVQRAGVEGVEIYAGGKIVGKGGKARAIRVMWGRLPKSGDVAHTLVKKANYTAYPKAGAIGIVVKVVPKGTVFPDTILRPHAEPAKVIEEKTTESGPLVQETPAEEKIAVLEKKIEEAGTPKEATVSDPTQKKKRAPRKKKEVLAAEQKVETPAVEVTPPLPAVEQPKSE